MSDGPYKSLLLPKRWKKVAEYLHKDAFEACDVLEKAQKALHRDAVLCGHKELVQALLKELYPDGQAPLFLDDSVRKLVSLREQLPADQFTDSLMRNLISKASNGQIGVDGFVGAVTSALHDSFGSKLYAFQEHYHIEGTNNQIRKMKEQCNEALSAANFSKLADVFINKLPISSISSTKQKNREDEGPLL